jgi:Transposase, Mutator family
LQIRSTATALVQISRNADSSPIVCQAGTEKINKSSDAIKKSSELVGPPRKPEFLIVNGGTGLEQALAALWGEVPTQRGTVHKHRTLLAHAPQRLHEEVSADYNDMIYATSAAEIEARRRAFIGKWRLKYKAVGDSLEEPVTGCSPSPGYPSANGRVPEPPTPSNGSTKN